MTKREKIITFCRDERDQKQREREKRDECLRVMREDESRSAADEKLESPVFIFVRERFTSSE